MVIDPLRFPEERRLATVLFADVQGFTALAEQLDFETVSDLLKSIWERLDKVIENHSGYIDKHLGDGVMSIWGAPFAGEHDAELAVSAGLDLIKALDEYCQGSGIRGAEKLKLRVGINTGLIFAGYVGTRREYTVLGDTVNVASRLEQTAQAGTVVIGENTLRMVRGRFRVRRLNPAIAKGKTELVQPYVVEERLHTPLGTQDQRPGNLESVMVGRDEELNKLKTMLARAFEGEKPVMAILNGDVGIGKTRLLLEFGSNLQKSSDIITIISTHGLAKNSRQPLSIWRLLLRNYFDIHDDDLPHVACDKWTTGFDRLWTAGQSTEKEHAKRLLTEVAGLGETITTLEAGKHSGEDLQVDEEKLHGITSAARHLLSRISIHRELVLLCDDLQFADRESLQLLAYIITSDQAPFRAMIVAAARPEFLKSKSLWHNLARVINLDPLDLNAEMVGRAYPNLRLLPESILQDIGQHAEGNPYFLGEIIKNLLKGSLHDADIEPQAVRNQLTSQIPETLRATLQARMDNLSREARAAALLASVVGRTFWVGAVLAAARSTPLPGETPLVNVPEAVIDRFIQMGLRQLARADLASPRSGTRFSDEQEYVFKNSYLRDVAYSLIPNRNRVQYHKAVAEWMAQIDEPVFQSLAREHQRKAETSAKISVGDHSITTPQP